MKPRALLVLLLLSSSLPLAAAPTTLSCEEGQAVFDADTARALQRQEPAGEDDFSSCKPWPADPTKTLYALASLEPGSADPQDPGAGEYDLDVLVTDSATGQVLARHRQRKALMSDAMRLKGITLDTARYQLAPGRRAFGLRAWQANHSNYNPGRFELFWLYLQEGRELHPLLAGMEVDSSAIEMMMDCSGDGTEVQRTLQVQKTSSKGLADLAVVTRTTELKLAGESCEEIRAKPVIRRDLLRYDGRAYPLPKSLRE